MVCLWYNVIQVVKKQFERNAGEKNMKKILDLITGEVTQAFVDCGYDAKYGKVTLSNRPDLCEYQCNGAMAAAKEYKKAPFMIADEVAEKLSGNAMFSMVESVNRAKDYISGALAAMLDLGKGSGPMDHGFAITWQRCRRTREDTAVRRPKSRRRS